MVFRAILLILLSLCAWGTAQEPTRFRLWMAGQEVGGREVQHSREGGRERVATREWVRLERLGMAIEQGIDQSAFRSADGALEFTWSLKLAQDPMEGRALWRPESPRSLVVRSAGLPERTVMLEGDLLLWPGDIEARLREAARLRRSVRILGYVPALQQATELELRCLGPEPLPGFPDTVRFSGKSREGAMVSDTDVWVSPVHGEVKETGSVGGMALLVQRAELPEPSPSGGPQFFERTLATLPPHPFLPWLSQATLSWKGDGDQRLPEDPQQKMVGRSKVRLTRAALPGAREATDMPVTGPAKAEDAPYLAATPLVPFRDPVFDGLLSRLDAPRGGTRWQLAQRVNRFVFDWITEKDFSVGFATALEVARRPKGDCTEHGVLAVALLRRLGVPARGVLGWIGTSSMMGLHFWVEVKLDRRWVPIDPTFAEAPSSALHLKLGTTALADLGSIGWDTAATRFVGGAWEPVSPWSESIRLQGDYVFAPGGESLRLPGAGWKLAAGTLTLRWKGVHRVEAIPHPLVSALKEAQPFESTRTHRRGWWSPEDRQLRLRLDDRHWLQVSDLERADALELLDQLEWHLADNS